MTSQQHEGPRKGALGNGDMDNSVQPHDSTNHTEHKQTRLSDCHYAPVIWSVVAGVGLVAASVFGYVWFLCRLNGDNKCFASQEAIAARLGLGHRTVRRKLKLLVERGYLVDTTPGRRNRPHVYVETGLAGRQELERKATENGDEYSDELLIEVYGE